MGNASVTMTMCRGLGFASIPASGCCRRCCPRSTAIKLQHTGDGGGAVLVKITIDDAAARDALTTTAMPELNLNLHVRPLLRPLVRPSTRFAIAVCHRRCGKTVAAAQRLLLSALTCERPTRASPTSLRHMDRRSAPHGTISKTWQRPSWQRHRMKASFGSTW